METTTTNQCLDCGALQVEAYCAHGKVLVTARQLLFRPGFLTGEFFAGRRAQYVRPLRLYLMFSVIYFAAIQLLPAGAAARSGFNIELRPSANETMADVQAALEARGFKNQEARCGP